MHVTLKAIAAALLAALWTAAGSHDLYAGASWQLQPYNLVIPTSISHAGQSTSGSLVLTLAHDTPCTIIVSVAQQGDQTLHGGASTLTTSYKLTGAALQNGDAAWVDADSFVGKIYSVQGVGPSDQITLYAQGAAASSTAVDAGAYSASLILTVSW